MKWPDELERELRRAREARLRGNEGRARVCARRAAGIAARMYLQRQGLHIASSSALDLLVRLAQEPTTDEATRHLVSLFTMPVDLGFKLPDGIDLIAAAETLSEQLLR